ncbi:hypothetical protein EJ04DRAFT_576751 [Polyplosphaeria fusca]|uniref:Uncharacterized protein n=1 Tax=Polyplosphaeria fusca TaxID=682080 RepID=A0A9P4QY84_9PLEO|nr:hypothetical protein EJ04DRAFT_576751 [Polyplosphaeria fusca]
MAPALPREGPSNTLTLYQVVRMQTLVACYKIFWALNDAVGNEDFQSKISLLRGMIHSPGYWPIIIKAESPLSRDLGASLFSAKEWMESVRLLFPTLANLEEDLIPFSELYNEQLDKLSTTPEGLVEHNGSPALYQAYFKYVDDSTYIPRDEASDFRTLLFRIWYQSELCETTKFVDYYKSCLDSRRTTAGQTNTSEKEKERQVDDSTPVEHIPSSTSKEGQKLVTNTKKVSEYSENAHGGGYFSPTHLIIRFHSVFNADNNTLSYQADFETDKQSLTIVIDDPFKVEPTVGELLGAIKEHWDMLVDNGLHEFMDLGTEVENVKKKFDKKYHKDG